MTQEWGSVPSSKWKEGGAKELLEKGRIILGRGHLFLGGGEGRGFLCRLPFLWWMERAYLTSYLVVLEQKIPYWGNQGPGSERGWNCGWIRLSD